MLLRFHVIQHSHSFKVRVEDQDFVVPTDWKRPFGACRFQVQDWRDALELNRGYFGQRPPFIARLSQRVDNYLAW